MQITGVGNIRFEGIVYKDYAIWNDDTVFGERYYMGVDLVGVQPLDQPMGLLYYVDTLHSGTTTNLTYDQDYILRSTSSSTVIAKIETLPDNNPLYNFQ